MRKLFLLFWALLATTALWAEDFEADGIYYNILDGNNVAVTYKGSFSTDYANEYSGEVTIPETVIYNGTTYSVTSIGDEAFYNCSSLTSITIPNSVTSIGNFAFSHCRSLVSMVIPGSVMRIGYWAFSRCRSLSSITIPQSVVSIGEALFVECSSLVSIVVESGNPTYDSRENCNAIIETATNSLVAGCQSTIIPNSVTSIGDYAFEYCSKLTSLTIPNSVISIGDNAFSNCSKLTSITIPNSVISIGGNAFQSCGSLTSLTIPNSVTSIGEGAFSGCSSLTSMVVEEGNTTYDSRDNCNAIIETATNTLIAGCQNTIIPNGVTSIGNYAFNGCSSLSSITIPNSVTSIGNFAFYSCRSLASITIPNSVTHIGEGAFGYCPLTSFTIPDGVTHIGAGTFSGCTSLTTITIPNSVTTIAFNAFSTCKFAKNNFINQSSLDAEANDYWGATIVDQDIDGLIIRNDTVIDYRGNLDTIVIPDGVIAIADGVFRNELGIKSITIPNSITSIGQGAFSDCSSLAKTNFTGDIIDWCKIEFGNAYANPINCSHNLYINDIEVKDLIIPEGVTSIGDAAFFKCTSLISITIPNSVTSIGDAAFFKCTSLTSVTISKGVTSIGYGAFYGCIFAKDKFINNSSLDAESNDFWGATIVDQIVDGLIIRNDTVIDYIGDMDTIVIPDGVLAIAGDVFRSNSKIKSVTIPNSVKSIGNYAFYKCSSLTSIAIPESVTTIGNNAFGYCTNLTSIVWNPISCTGFWTEETTYCIFYGCDNVTSVVFGENVAEIPRYLCWKMSKLDSVIIPESVKTIGDYAFSYCYSLDTIIIPDNVTDVKRGAFYDCSHLKSVTIGNGVKTIGDYAFYDCSHLKSVTIGNGVKTIGDYAFYDCVALQNAILGNRVTAIGKSAFYKCASLVSITLGDGLQDVGDYAFYECSALESIRIPESVAHIGSDAFNGCASLPSITIPKSVTSIGSNAFYDCFFTKNNFINNSSLDEVANKYWGAEIADIEQDGLFIRNDTVVGCRPLVTSVVIPDTITCIKDYAFRGCSLLTALTIPNSVTSIGISAFNGCSSLNSITIPNSVINIGRFAFEGTGFYNNESNWENDVLYIDNCLIRARETITGTYNIKENTRMIGGGAFWFCTSLESIAIPESVTNIGEYAFVGCELITSIDLPNRITSIGRSTFQQCYALTSVTIPNSVTSIGRSAFQNDSALTSITIPKGITSVGQQAFYNCPLLDTINVNTSTPPVLGNRAFYNTPASICYIPCGTKAAYEASDWAQYMGEFVEHAVELTSGICGENLFWEYADTKLSISGEGAMYDNIVECLPWAWLLDSIRSIEMSEGITHIAAYAFDGCSALRELHLPASVQSIGEYAFGNTPRLYEITCLAPEPPVADLSSFTNYDAYLHAYCDAQRYYSIDPVWKNFHNVECIVTENELTGDVTITPSDYEATVVWLSHADAAAYALVITKNDVTFCTLKFNKYGQLTNIAFAPSRTHHNKQQAAEATSTGYSFTITGLDENTTYGYAFSVLNEESAVIEEFVGEFTTQSNVSTSVDNVDASNHSIQKLLRDGHLVIIRDGVEYNVMGQHL